MNVTNAVLHVLPVVMTAVGVVVVIIEEEVMEDMAVTEEEDLGTMMEVEIMIIMVEGVVTMMAEVEGAIEVAHMVVIKAEKMVAMVKLLLQLLLSLMEVVVVETTHLLMEGMQIMKQMLFLHPQAILAVLIRILLHMGVMLVVMGETIRVMHGVVVGLRLQLDMTVVIVVDLVELLLSQLLL
jgi:hypothetical protein